MPPSETTSLGKDRAGSSWQTKHYFGCQDNIHAYLSQHQNSVDSCVDFTVNF